MTLHQDFIHELGRQFSGEIRVDAASRVLYSTDASIYQIEPLGVLIPKTQEDLIAAVTLAAKYEIPILPRGAGSSLAGQAIGKALVLDFSRYLDALLSLDPESRTATVEPGLLLSTLNRAAARYGLTFGPDPASGDRSTVGGVIGNNATGAHSIRYGMAADHILAAEVLLSDGSLARFGEDGRGGERYRAILAAAEDIRESYAEIIRENWTKTWRNTSGYRLNYLLPWSPSRPPQWEGAYPPPRSAENLAPLLAGSEGTLAVFRSLTLRLVPKPAATVLAILPFPDIVAACEAVPRILEFSPSAVELIPRELIHLARGVPAYARLVDFVEGDPAALLAVEFSGETTAEVQSHAAALSDALRLDGVRVATTEDAQRHVWTVRKVGLGILMSTPARARPVAFIEDCAVPVERLGEFAREMERILAAHGTTAAFYAHASAGCLHIRPAVDLMSGEVGGAEIRAIAEATLALVLRLGGTMTGEHGDGLARSEWISQVYGQDVASAFRRLKTAADPKGLLNPGKIVDPSPMDENLRAFPQDTAWQPVLDFSRQGGLLGAVSQCNGAGVCRKSEGLMCPSFQATREEANATRGRANLLRSMMVEAERGVRERFALLEEAVAKALDLCLACKGCKAECPSGVDMAKLKYEFFHRYYQTHRRRLRDYVFGYIGRLAVWGGRVPALFNALMYFPPTDALLKIALGVASERELPRFRMRAHAPRPLSEAEAVETVLYLPDAFTRYFEPDIEAATLEVLAAAGVRVLVLPILGAGRTLISKSFLDAAKRHARAVLDAIARLDPEGRFAIIGAEPSEIYTLRDEFLDFFPNDAHARRAASRAWLAEEFLLRPDSSGEKPILRVVNTIYSHPSPTPTQKEKKAKILLHGHCHQKARPPAEDGYPVGQEATAEVLRAVGYEVEILPTGCCGMAGAFGYEAEHYDLSMKVGELALFPALREEGDVPVVAPGASCRAQIHDGVHRSADHPMTRLAARLHLRTQEENQR